MGYLVHIAKKAQRQLKSLPRQARQNILPKIDQLKEDSRPQGAKKLTDITGLYRLRVGDYRIVYCVEDNLLLVLVVLVGHRKDVYEKLTAKLDDTKLRSLIEEVAKTIH